MLRKKVDTGSTASRLASPPPRKHASFIQSRLLWVKALHVLRRQELCSPQPAATFAHLAWVLQSGSSRPLAPHQCQLCFAEMSVWLLGTQEHQQVGPGSPRLLRARAEGAMLAGVGWAAHLSRQHCSSSPWQGWY